MARRSNRSRPSRPSVWNMRCRNGKYITAICPNKLPPTARLNIRLPASFSSPRSTLFPSLRHVSALNMSKNTKQVKVMVVSRALMERSMMSVPSMMTVADVRTRWIKARLRTRAVFDRGGRDMTAGSTGSTPRD
ncbi:MAG: hypothetical protein Q9193_000125 [Seirophora villosa]